MGAAFDISDPKRSNLRGACRWLAGDRSGACELYYHSLSIAGVLCGVEMARSEAEELLSTTDAGPAKLCLPGGMPWFGEGDSALPSTTVRGFCGSAAERMVGAKLAHYFPTEGTRLSLS